MIKPLPNVLPNSQSTFLLLAKTVLLILLFCPSLPAKAQAIIYTVKGAAISCKVQEIGDDSVAYNEATDLAGKPKLILKQEISIIRYTKDNYEEPFNTDVILTAAGKQIYARIVATDETSGFITYSVPGAAEPEKMATKNVRIVKYANGVKKSFNLPGQQKPLPGIVTLPPKVDAETSQKNNSMLTILQNWKSKYMAPPLDVL
jgi:hypothetical protein